MLIKHIGKNIQVTLNDNERYNTSIFQQLSEIHSNHPSFNVGKADRTKEGWIIPPGQTSERYLKILRENTMEALTN
jgi:hypothetical protein